MVDNIILEDENRTRRQEKKDGRQENKQKQKVFNDITVESTKQTCINQSCYLCSPIKIITKTHIIPCTHSILLSTTTAWGQKSITWHDVSRTEERPFIKMFPLQSVDHSLINIFVFEWGPGRFRFFFISKS